LPDGVATTRVGCADVSVDVSVDVSGADVEDDPQAITMAKATRSGVIVNALDLDSK